VTRLLFQLFYFLRSASAGLRGSPLPTGVSILTIAVATIPLGGLWVVTGNMRALLDQFGSELQLTAFLESNVRSDAGRSLAAKASAIPGVERVEFVSQELALERFRTRLGGSALVDALETNPLPASLMVALAADARTPERVAVISEALHAIPGVEDVAGGETWIEGYGRALRLVRSAGIGLGTVLALATLLIVANTIRLAVYARRDELEILSLVGASRTYVRVPFLLEGLVQGAIGGLFGVALLYVIFQVAVPQLRDALELFLGWSDPAFLSPRNVGILVAGGAGFGFAGAAVAALRTRVS
jgi:cell division transport system permease protein